MFGQRYYAQASLRILLSDRATDITGLPRIAAGAPLDLSDPAGYAAQVGPPFRTPIAQSPAPEPFTPATGISQMRLNGTPAAGATVLPVEHNIPAGGAYAQAVPAWLGGTNFLAAWNPVGNAQGRRIQPALHRDGSGRPSRLRHQRRSAAANRHPAYPVGTMVTIVRQDGRPSNCPSRPPPPSTVRRLRCRPHRGSDCVAVFLPAPVLHRRRSRPLHGLPPAAGRHGPTRQRADRLHYPAGATFNDDDPIYTGATTAAGTPLLNGFIKIEKQNAAGVWSDVTLEILNLGFAGRNQEGIRRGDPTPDAVIRLQRFRDNGFPAGMCTAGAD